MTKTHMKLTDPERMIIVNALTRAAVQYEKDAERVLELAQYGMTIKEPAEALAGQFRQHSTDARQLRDKIAFLWAYLQF
jgi:hypothetical protein